MRKQVPYIIFSVILIVSIVLTSCNQDTGRLNSNFAKLVDRVTVSLSGGFGKAWNNIMALVSGNQNVIGKKERWDYWFAVDDRNPMQISHLEWDNFLKKHLFQNDSGQSFVKYSEITPKDLTSLQYYLLYLIQIPITTYSRNEQLAYWINLYNALTLSMVIKYYPVKSIKNIDISPGTFSNGPWGKRAIVVEKQILSLDEIQNKILRPIWNDERIHYALSNASVGGPSLAMDAYEGSIIDDQLNKARTRYINHTRGVSVNNKGIFTVSSLYKWYLFDFAPDNAALIAYWQKYASPELQAHFRSSRNEKSKILYRYDWKLNDAQSLE